MDGREIIKRYFGKTIPQRKNETTKLRTIKRAVSKRGLSLIHKEVLSKKPKNCLWSYIPSISPKSYQTTSGKRMQKILISELKNKPITNAIAETIGDKDICIFILYCLVNTNKKRDLDNYTKNIIDGLHKSGLFKDDKQIKLLTSKFQYINVKDKTYPFALENPVIAIDFFNDNHKIVMAVNKFFNM